MNWQPLDSAPKDGTPILVCKANYWSDRFHLHGFPQVVSWRQYHPNAKGKTCWRDASGGKIDYATHWMPVMEDPK